MKTADFTRTSLTEGLRRGGRELQQVGSSGEDLLGNVIWVIAILTPVWVMRDQTVPSSDISAASYLLPSLMVMSVVFHGTFSLAQQLVADRNDGTLVRLRTVPQGVQAYLIGKIVLVSSMVVIVCLLLTIAGTILTDDIIAFEPSLWLGLAWTIPLSLLAILPFGAILGLTVTTARNVNIVLFPLLGLAALSGTFAPITGYPQWLQFIVMALPLYWVALGARAALLPDGFASAEIAGSWQTLETVAVLGVWAVAGCLLAPIALRRVKLRRSGTLSRLGTTGA
ncbi:ABC transporter [Rathayibacter tritici]|uniref:ABC transporter permease n=1 Tax=Rathayibacter tritici TaxID=33888 RepID=UPI000CE9238D|nr:ABC transporter permease [Rathayibacter tritici]PPF23701.1 ABC transporter [Rathayibacter tritici]PPI19327.1 ABC transporter [Rathayibacter tritici]